MAKAGVYATYGPNWNTENICENVSEEICSWAQNLGEDDQQPVGFKLEDHFKQMVSVERFQEYIEDWSASNNESDLYGLTEISIVPITLMAATKDFVCPYDKSLRLAG